MQSWLAALEKHAEGRSVAAAVRAQAQQVRQGGQLDEQENTDPQGQPAVAKGGHQKEGVRKKPRLGGWGAASNLALGSKGEQGGGSVHAHGLAAGGAEQRSTGGLAGSTSGKQQAHMSAGLNGAHCNSVTVGGLAGLLAPPPSLAAGAASRTQAVASPVVEAAASVVPQLFRRRSGACHAAVAGSAHSAGVVDQRPGNTGNVEAAGAMKVNADVEQAQLQAQPCETSRAGEGGSAPVGLPAQQHVSRAGLGLSRNGARRGFKPPLVAKPPP